MTTPFEAALRPMLLPYNGMDGMTAPTPMNKMNCETSKIARGAATVSRGTPRIKGDVLSSSLVGPLFGALNRGAMALQTSPRRRYGTMNAET
mmetsp:Transcript_18692/g.44075  ORF Transcript_18692/g.44075 Transcript_18692/m.44075 type:complete len:92 (-) Transcript_18692:68-343(-)